MAIQFENGNSYMSSRNTFFPLLITDFLLLTRWDILAADLSHRLPPLETDVVFLGQKDYICFTEWIVINAEFGGTKDL